MIGDYEKLNFVNGNAPALNAANLNKIDSKINELDNAAKSTLDREGVANGLATLDNDGKIPSTQIPAIALINTFVCANQTEHLAVDAQIGDVVVRTDENKTYILQNEGANSFSNWVLMRTPTDLIQSVDGLVGNVDLTGIYVSNYRTAKTYTLNEACFYNGVPYKSLANGNNNHQPDTSPAYWEITGGGAGGVVNVGYNLSDGQIEKHVASYTVYNDLAAAPVDGLNGTVNSNFTFTLNSNSPLVGVADGLISKAGTLNLQGHGVSKSFTIDKGLLSSIAQISFNYSTSASYVGGDMGLYLLDVTNNNIIPLSVKDIPATYGSASQFLANFIPSTSTSYRLCWHIQSTSTANYTCQLDNIQVGNKSVAVGAAIGRLPDYVPTFSASFGTVIVANAEARRVGEILNGSGIFTAGTLTSSVGSMSIPSGLTIGGNQTVQRVIGKWWRHSVFANTPKQGTLVYSPANPNLIFFSTDEYLMTATPISIASALNSLINTGDAVFYEFSVPITQWTSNINLASDFTEYASNSGGEGVAAGTTYSNSSYCLNGSDGSYIPAVVSTNITGQTTDYIVKFSRPIMPTDSISIEILFNGDTVWRNCEDIYPRIAQNTARYGLHRATTNSSPLGANYIFVSFGNAGAVSNGATYGAVSVAPWSNYIAGGSMPTKWRVRKVSNGNMAETRNDFITASSGERIRKKIFTGTTASTAGAAVTIPHGLDATKIISITGSIYISPNVINLNYILEDGTRIMHTACFANAANLILYNDTTMSASYLGKPYKILVEYME